MEDTTVLYPCIPWCEGVCSRQLDSWCRKAKVKVRKMCVLYISTLTYSLMIYIYIYVLVHCERHERRGARDGGDRRGVCKVPRLPGKPPVPDADEFLSGGAHGSAFMSGWGRRSGAQRMDNLSAALCKRRGPNHTVDAASQLHRRGIPAAATIFKGTAATAARAEGLAQRICARTGQVVSTSLSVGATPDPPRVDVEKLRET